MADVKFDDRAVREQLKKLKTADSSIKGYDVGFFEGRYPPKPRKSTKKRKTSQGVKEGPTIASVAFNNEFGTKDIPSRPFFAIGNKNAEKVLVKILKRGIKYEEGFRITSNLIKILGNAHKAEIQKSIVALKSPPNKPSTIRSKTSRTGGTKNNPLIDTGTMVAHITYKIVKGE